MAQPQNTSQSEFDERRGITNARVRFEKREQERLTQNELRGKKAANDDRYDNIANINEKKFSSDRMRRDEMAKMDERRRIQNTQARFAQKQDERSLQNNLVNGMSTSRFVADTVKTKNGNVGNLSSSHSMVEKNAIYEKTLLDLGKNEFDITKEDIDLAVQAQPEKPKFPYGIFLVALIKDTLDIVFTMSIVGIILVLPLSFFMSLVLFFWLYGKLSGGWYKKKIIKWIWKRFFITIGLEALPFFGMIPATSIFVFMAHNKESKVVQIFDDILESIHRKGISLKK